MKLSILIPTYNRCKDLQYNISLLNEFIIQDKLETEVSICISDNASTDDTFDVLKSLRCSFEINYFRQETNIGYCKNVLYLLSKSKTEWVLLLGDDDYLEPWYIKECLRQINLNKDLGCIIPNYIDFDPTTGKYGNLREENCETRLYKAGFECCRDNVWRAHQLSGLCFKKLDLVEQFKKFEMDNLYPQIFFVGYNALSNDVLHFGQKCLCVSSVQQSKKDWVYGNDGLMNDICENFKNLKISYKEKAKLESYFNKRQKRYLWATNNSDDCIDNILNAKNISLLGKYYISCQIINDIKYNGKSKKMWFYIVKKILFLKNYFRYKIVK